MKWLKCGVTSPIYPKDCPFAVRTVLKRSCAPPLGARGLKRKTARGPKRKKARGGRVTAYVCENQVCKLPTADPDVFATQLASVKAFSAAEPEAEPDPE